MMSTLVVRRLLIDLKSPPTRHWCAGDPFQTAFFNALSISFPFGEQFFIDAVRAGSALLPPDRRQEFAAEAQGFIGQEATHRRVHAMFNAHLQQQGLIDRWTPRAEARMKALDASDPRHALAITAATEHFTAILADFLLRNHDLLDHAEPRLKTMWLWHSAEESEHRNTAFDLYHACGGNQPWRLRWFRRVTLLFLTDLLRQTCSNLYRDGSLFKFRTLRSAAVFLFGKRGVVRQTAGPWRAYLKPDFHPSHQDASLSSRWLQEHATQYSVVTATGSAPCEP